MATGTCEQCGASFTFSPSQARRFCSRDCWKAAKAAAGPKVERACERCGRPRQVYASASAQVGRFCSAECRDQAPRVVPRQIRCATCGNAFAPRSTASLYCSKLCSGKARRTMVERSCVACGKPYLAKPSRLADGKDLLYCSRECAFPGPVVQSCAKCGTTFTASRSEIERGWGRFCSNNCRRTGRQAPCGSCGEPVWLRPSKEAAQVSVYCSVRCRGLGLRNRTTLVCHECGTHFERPASVPRGSAVFCTKTCMTAGQRRDPATAERTRQMQRNMLASKEPTRCEEILYSLLDEVVGEGLWQRQLLVFGKWTVDAAIPELQLILQADGDYWHGRALEHRSHPKVAANMANDARQGTYSAKVGWHVERFWEGDLKSDPDRCQRRLEAVLQERLKAIAYDASPAAE